MTNNTLGKILQKFKGGGAEGTLLRGAGSLVLLNPLSLAISFVVMSILLPRVMSTESYGIYSVAMNYLQLFVLLALMGQDTSLMRFVPQYTVQGKWGLLRGIISKTIQVAQIVAIPLALVLALVIYWLSPNLGPEKSLTFFVTLPLIPILCFTGIREATLRSLKKVVYSYVPDSIVRPLVLGVLALGVSFWIQRPITAPMLMALGVAAVLCSTLLGSYWLYKSLPDQVVRATPEYESNHWIKVSLPLFFISGMNLILKRTDVLMLDILQGAASVAYYTVATRLADLAAFGLLVVNMIAAPMISELFNKGNRQELQRIITLAARGIFVLTLMITLVLIFGGKLLLGISGSDYTIAYPALLILLAGQVVNALSGSVGFIMTMTGYQNQAAMIVAGGAVLSILLNAILIPPFGMNGAAIATAITTALWNILMLIFVMKKLKLNPTVIS
jgi:O-antigen/teichoic acid export membrane protein